MQILGTVISAPIKITDRDANEQQSGLCPALKQTLSLTQSSSAEVLSEYATRLAISGEIESKLFLYPHYTDSNNISAGVVNVANEFEEEFKRLRFKNFSVSPDAASQERITVAPVDGGLRISYDNRVSINETYFKNYTYKVNVSGDTFEIKEYNFNGVQGGKNQVELNIDCGKAFSSLLPSSDSPNSQFVWYYANGVTKDEYNYPILLNSRDTSICNLCKNTNISIGKIGIQVPVNDAFAVSGQMIIIGSGYDSTTNVMSNPMIYFYTPTKECILSGFVNPEYSFEPAGEWRQVYYYPDFQQKQYQYFENPDTISVSATNLVVARGPGNTIGAQPIGDYAGKFNIRIFFDLIQYSPYNGMFGPIGDVEDPVIPGVPPETLKQLFYGYSIGNLGRVARKENSHPGAVPQEPIVDKLNYVTETWDFDSVPSVPAYGSNDRYRYQYQGAAVENEEFGLIVAKYNRQVDAAFKLNWATYGWSSITGISSVVMFKGAQFSSHQDNTAYKNPTAGYFICGKKGAVLNRSLVGFDFATDTFVVLKELTNDHMFLSATGASNATSMFIPNMQKYARNRGRPEVLKYNFSDGTYLYRNVPYGEYDKNGLTNIPNTFTDGGSFAWFRPNASANIYELNMSTELTQSVYNSGKKPNKKFRYKDSCGVHNWTRGYYLDAGHPRFVPQRFDYQTATLSTAKFTKIKRRFAIPTQSG